MYKWVRKWVRTCETCQRVKPSKSSQAPLHPLPIATEAWRSVSMDFVFGLPPDADGRNGVLVFVDRFTKMVHFTPVKDTVTAAETAAHFVDCVFRHHGLPESIVSDRDPRFTSAFWTALFQLLGTKLSLSTATHPETDGQTERVNRVLEDVLRSYATSFVSWSKFLPLAEFALNNAEHASTGLTPFFANNARHPRVPALLAVGHPTVSRASTLGGDDDGVNDDYVETSGAHDPETLYAVTRSKAKQALATPGPAASPLAAWTARTLIDPVIPVLKLQPTTRRSPRRAKSITPPFRHSSSEARQSPVLCAMRFKMQWINKKRTQTNVNGEAFTLDIPTSLRLHPTFYVGRLKKYHPAAIPSTLDPTAAPEHRANAPPGVPSEVLQRRESPAPESAPVTPDSTGALLQGPSGSPRSAQSPHQLPPERPEHDSLQSPHPPGTPRRKPYRREPPPPIVDSAGQKRWIVDHLVAHEDPPHATPRTRTRVNRTSTSGIPPARRYQVRWLGYPPDEDTWEPRSSLLRDVPDAVLEYENEIVNENAAVADHAVTESTNDYAPTRIRLAENERGGPRRE
ncbi:Reverse transcriptase, partial [Phytophthora palmivora]